MWSSVFSRCLNVLGVASDVTETGRLFHTRAAATGKARSPTVERRVGGTTRPLVVADRSRRRVSVETGCSSLARYGCARPWRQVEWWLTCFTNGFNTAIFLQRWTTRNSSNAVVCRKTRKKSPHILTVNKKYSRLQTTRIGACLAACRL